MILKELGPVLDRVKDLQRSGLTSLMVLGDLLKWRIAPLQQRSRMAYMYTGLNDCSRIIRGPGSEFTRVELEAALRAMTGEAFSPESLVLPSGVKALCKDQALRSSVLASMLTLDEGGLAVRQLGGDPNRGLQIPGATPDRQQRTSEGPGEPRPGGGPRRERKGEGASARAPAQGQCGCCPGPKERRGPGGGTRAEQPSRREQVPEAPAWRRLLGGGAGV
jgi:hypothetical protein